MDRGAEIVDPAARSAAWIPEIEGCAVGRENRGEDHVAFGSAAVCVVKPLFPHIGESLGHLAGELSQIRLNKIQGGAAAVVRVGGPIGRLAAV